MRDFVPVRRVMGDLPRPRGVDRLPRRQNRELTQEIALLTIHPREGTSGDQSVSLEFSPVQLFDRVFGGLFGV